MKQVKRRLLSVVMALAILCTLVPSALAYTGYGSYLAVGQSTTVTGPFADNVSTGFFPLPLSRVNWQSSAPSIASVQSTGTKTAIVTGISVGTATITGVPVYNFLGTEQEFPSESYSFTVTVSGTGYPGGGGSATGYHTSLSQGSMALTINGNSYLSVSAMSTYYQIQNVTWSSSNTAVANVTPYSSGTNSAYVTGYTNGTATIYATVTGWDSYSYQQFTDYLACVVTVGTGAGTGVVTLLTAGENGPAFCCAH